MCFSPTISLTTFVIEFILAIYFVAIAPKDKLNKIIGRVTAFLALYQLNEFLICTTGNTIHTRFALIITALLPVYGVLYAFKMIRKKITLNQRLILYATPIVFCIYFAFTQIYNNPTACLNMFIQYPKLGFAAKLYGLYYFTYLLFSIYIFYRGIKQTRNKMLRRFYELGILSILIFTVPTFLFIIILPQYFILFPSVLCQFALLLAILFVYIIYYKQKNKLVYTV